MKIYFERLTTFSKIDQFMRKGLYTNREKRKRGHALLQERWSQMAVQMAVERVQTHLSLLLLADNKGREVLLKTLIIWVYVSGGFSTHLPATMPD